MTPDWAPQQRDALAAVGRWLDSGAKPWFYLAGYAGTGKTTLAKHFAAEVRGYVPFCAYTGKAALVLQQKGCIGATTIHKLIYLPKEKCRAKLAQLERRLKDLTAVAVGSTTDVGRELGQLEAQIRDEKANLRGPAFTVNKDSEIKQAALVVVDEVSMVGQRMAEDLLSFGVPVLVLGDPAQLPPVRDGGYFTAQQPDFLLTEVHRQAAGSGILELATRVRRGAAIMAVTGPIGDDCRVVPKGGISMAEVMNYDQVLCGRNVRRHSLNRLLRKELGRLSPLPESGDKVVCCRNDHEVGLLNGQQWRVHSCTEEGPDRLRLTITEWGEETDASAPLEVTAHRSPFDEPEKELSFWDAKSAQEFQFAYAMTVHKAQGSQWNRVVLVDESWAFRQDAAKWLYTGVTRAAKELVVVMT